MVPAGPAALARRGWPPRRPCRSRRRRPASRSRRPSARRSASPTSASSATARPKASSEPVLDISPADDYAHYALGRCLEMQGKSVEANGHYKLASRMRPESAGLLLAHPRPRLIGADGAEDDHPAERRSVDLPRVAARTASRLPVIVVLRERRNRRPRPGHHAPVVAECDRDLRGPTSEPSATATRAAPSFPSTRASSAPTTRSETSPWRASRQSCSSRRSAPSVTLPVSSQAGGRPASGRLTPPHFAARYLRAPRSGAVPMNGA